MGSYAREPKNVPKNIPNDGVDTWQDLICGRICIHAGFIFLLGKYQLHGGGI